MAMTISTDVTVDQNAYNLATDYALRAELYFDAFASVKPDRQAHPGKAVIFNITSDLAQVTTALDESTDVTPASMSDSQVTVTLQEFGNAVKTTAYLRGTSYVVPYDAAVANVIGFNAGLSIDAIARNMIQGGSNVRYGGAATSRVTVAGTHTLDSADVRRAVAELKGANVQSFGGYYAGVIHPDVAFDFRGETGGAAWRDPHVYSQPAEIWNGEMGAFEGVRFIEASRAPMFADGGVGGLIDVYGTLIFGQQAIAKAHSYTDGNGAMPQMIPGPVTDTLRRFVPLGWYWFGGYAIYRQAALRRIEAASSIGANT